MDKPEPGSGSGPAKTAARQLDFTAICRASAATAILPDHPQAQLQSKLLALALKRQAEAEPKGNAARPDPEVDPKVKRAVQGDGVVGSGGEKANLR